MSDYHIGKLIRGFRESKHISRQALYYGLRDVRLVSKMENGEQEMSKLLVDVLLERMGLSTDMYGYVFTIKEYQQFQTRADILELLEKGDYTEAENLCNEYEKAADKRDRLENQFMRTIRLLIAMEKGAEPEYLLEEAKEILFLTVPKFKIRNINEYMLSGTERMLIALQAEAYCRMGNQETGLDEYYYSLLFHLERYCTDPWEQERQIPPLIMIMVRWMWKWERYSEMWICEKAIKILRNGMRLTLLEPLMEYEMKAWEKGAIPVPDGESENEWRAGLDALTEVREEYNVPRRHTEENMDISLFTLMIRQNYRGQILGDVIRRIRMEKGMSVEELAEGICEPENLRKIELGTMRPREKTYAELMRRLGQREYEYHPLICSDDYRVYECFKEIKRYMSMYENQKAEYELKKLDRELDKQYKVNWQKMLRFHGVIEGRLKKISLVDTMGKLQEAIHITMPREAELEHWPLNGEEAILWNSFAGIIAKMGESEKAIEILKKVKKSYEQSYLELKSNKGEYMMVLRNLCTTLGRKRQYVEGYEIVQYAIQLAIKWELCNELNSLLYKKVWLLEKMMEEKQINKDEIKEKYFPLLKQNYFLASIIQYDFYKKHIEKHCKEFYNVSLEWLF